MDDNRVEILLVEDNPHDAEMTIRTLKIMTSSKEEQDMIMSYNLGVNSYVVKPVNFESFAKAVSELGFYRLITNQPVD
jgi:DNA-binding NarL/FixJ family response regulator